ncbi:MAG: glucose PTS transporter subunit IIA [Bacilli bacterium]
MDYMLIARKILTETGGVDNIENATHCATRLRLEVYDKDKVNKETLNSIEDVQGVVLGVKQIQIILGPGIVDEVYKSFGDLLGEVTLYKEKNKENKEKFTIKGIFDILLETISSIFAPIIPAIVGCGLLMGMLYTLQLIGWIDTESGIYNILNVFSNASFYFLPVFLAFSSAKQFKCNPYVAAALGTILVHPIFIEMADSGNGAINLGIIHIQLQNYSSSVMPIILTVYLMSWVEKGCKKIVPNMFDLILTPVITLFVSGVIGLWLLAPIGQYAGDFVAEGFVNFYNHFGILAGLIFGLTYPFTLATGMQVAFTPLIAMNLTTLGYDFIFPLDAVSNSAMGAAAIYIFLKEKDPNLKQLAGSTGITGLVGVTEPVLFGIVLKYKKVLFAVMAGGAVGGTIMGFFKVTYAGFGFVPFGTILLAFGDTFAYYMLGCVSAMVVTVVILHFTGYKNEVVKEALELSSPVSGKIISLTDVNDPIFSEKMLGDGIAILPQNGTVVAPCNGEIVSIYPTKHAICIKSDYGVEILIHIGIDTVNLNGNGFEAFIKDGDVIKMGDKLVDVDLNVVKNKGFDPIICMVVTNSTEYNIEKNPPNKKINVKDKVLNLSIKENN